MSCEETEQLVSGCADLALSIASDQCERMVQFLDRLYEANEQINLTRIPRDEAVTFHLLDSIMVAKAVRISGAESFVDIGCGAGFPGVPLKILFPSLRLTLVDSVAKKLRFIERTLAVLQVEGVEYVHARAEDLIDDRRYQGRFDLGAARAVAKIEKLVPLVMPLLQPNGQFVALKSDQIEGELADARRLVNCFPGITFNPLPVILPGTNIIRNCVVISRRTGASL